MTLDPAHLTPAASLNRVRIVDLPGVALDDAIRGKTAYELLAARRMRLSVRVKGEEVDSGCVCAWSLGPELSPPP